MLLINNIEYDNGTITRSSALSLLFLILATGRCRPVGMELVSFGCWLKADADIFVTLASVVITGTPA